MFVPRSVRRKPVAKSKPPIRRKNTPEKEQDDEIADNSEDIVKYSKNQRWPAPDEPSCIVCGKYGAYICDSTDQDVCSIECKTKHLENVTSNESRDPEDGGKCEEKFGIVESVEESSDTLDSARRHVKYVYQEHPVVREMTEEQTRKLRKAVVCLRVCPFKCCLCVLTCICLASPTNIYTVFYKSSLIFKSKATTYQNQSVNSPTAVST